MPKQTFEAALPAGYRQAYYLNAKHTKTGLVLSLLSLVPLIPAIVLAVRLPQLLPDVGSWLLLRGMPLRVLDFLALYVHLMVVQEHLHGLAYRLLTRQKLRFGLSWSCAWCGVPDIYVYRGASMVALILPFAVITVLLAALLWAFRSDSVLLGVTILMLGAHTGGCVGDLYLFALFLFRYRSPAALIRDTGPEQTVYLPGEPGEEREPDGPAQP